MARRAAVDGKWMLWAILGCGAFTWVGFLYVGLKKHRRDWLAFAAFYFLVAVLFLALAAAAPRDADGNLDQDDWRGQVGAILMLITWGVGIIHTLLANYGWRGMVAGNVRVLDVPPATPYPWPRAGLPSALQEPWSGFVRNAVASRDRFRSAVAPMAAGPLRDSLLSLADRIDSSVADCERIAASGQVLAQARSAIDSPAISSAMQAAEVELAADPADDDAAQTLAALQAQAATASRLDAALDDTSSQLRLLDARLGEVLARALELSAQAATASSTSPLTTNITTIATDLEALRQALTELNPTLPTP